jgi:trehalose/maltose hydrolase-like predicted phosphorylase
MLEYRLRRLPAAREIARRAGRAGARFPWESARTGLDVTPRVAIDRTGRRVPIRTGLIEEHIVAQVAWAACLYTDWSGDDEFAHGPGLELLVETARYWSSRSRVGHDGRAHIYGVIGPDEYHETVDDNAYTNVMARWNLRRAADAVEAAPQAPDVDTAEVVRWRRLADGLVDGFDPATGIYEQFAGFHRLEALLIEEVAPRRPIAADLLLGAERVRAAQILKQADVLMLHHQVPDEVAPGSLSANLAFYEPRTAHGSSLSPAIHAALFARTGDHDRALDAMRIAARIDLDDLTGTTSSGLHLATMGGLWQALAFGIAGLRPVAGRLVVDPRHPDPWAEFEIKVRHRGSRVSVGTERSRLTVRAEPPAAVVVGGAPYTADADGLTFVRREDGWETEAK